jgi:arylsulfatase A-like enzyme
MRWILVLLGLGSVAAASAVVRRHDDPVAPPPARQDAAAETPRQRSVVFYLIDTCRADRMSVNGHSRPTTPFLEKLAARGARFSHCFSQAPWTKPSMSSILTSCYPSVTGMYRLLDRLDDSFTTLPEVFREAGWYTAGFSCNPLMGRLSNYAQGFRKFVEATTIIPNGDPIGFASGSAKRMNEKALPWLEAHKTWPYFLYLHSVDPHEEYEPAAEYLAMFGDPAGEAEYRRQWQALIDVKTVKVANHCTAEHFEAAGVPIDSFVSYGLDLYDADIRANDDEISRVVAALEARGDLDDSIVVITADHGEEFMEHGGTSHGFTVWNELIHVPLIVIAPGLIPPGLVIDAPVQSLDIYPTLCELAGLATPEGIQGESLAHLLRGEEHDGRRVFAENHEVTGGEQYFFSQGNTLTVIEGAWKLILNLKSSYNRPRPRRELYRIDRDFEERTDLAPDMPELADRLEGVVLDWWAHNRARHEGVAVTELSIDQLQHADPATLERLRQLGYIK